MYVALPLVVAPPPPIAAHSFDHTCRCLHTLFVLTVASTTLVPGWWDRTWAFVLHTVLLPSTNMTTALQVDMTSGPIDANILRPCRPNATACIPRPSPTRLLRCAYSWMRVFLLLWTVPVVIHNAHGTTLFVPDRGLPCRSRAYQQHADALPVDYQYPIHYYPTPTLPGATLPHCLPHLPAPCRTTTCRRCTATRGNPTTRALNSH